VVPAKGGDELDAERAAGGQPPIGGHHGYCWTVPGDFPALYRLGIVGAGQIARMTHQAALKLGITPRLLAEHLDDSAAQAAPEAMFGHPDTLAAFAECCEVLTFEHERLDLGLVQLIEDSGVVVRPGSKTIRAAFDKLHQRRILLNRGFPVPDFAEVRGPDDLFDFASAHGFPVVLKSVRAGRPGQRGVWIVENRTEALRVLAEQGDRELMAEVFQAIVKELVVLVVRRPGGSTRSYAIAEMVYQDGYCREIRVPAAIGHQVATRARELSLQLADELEAVGVLAVELFLTPDGLIVNELAARPHNAGHVTIEGSPTSQFENHVRAVLDLPLGPTWTNAPAAVTINVIGGLDMVDPADNLPDALAVEGAQVHLYGKIPRPGRKLGHVTALGDDIEQARELARRAEAALHGRRL
jgi:5-(carboxyamino)imidazole ribonucleotide synthase